MNAIKTIGIPAAGAYLGVRVSELFNQKGIVGAVLGIVGAGLGIYVAGKVRAAV